MSGEDRSVYVAGEIALLRDKAVHENVRLLFQKTHCIDVTVFPRKYRNNFISFLPYRNAIRTHSAQRGGFLQTILHPRIRKQLLLMTSAYDSEIF